MMVRLTSISGSKDAPVCITWLEYLPTHSESETICARNGLDSLLASSMQSTASVLHSRRFQSIASISATPLTPALCASISAPVTCPNKRYSVLRGFSAASCALWYAWTAIDKPFLFKVEEGSALDQRLVIGAAHHVAADLHARRERLAFADRIHELGHAQREMAVVDVGLVGIEIHHHDGKIDPARRRGRVLRLHDVLLAKHAGLVLDDEAGALVAIGENRAVQDELLAWFERQLQRHGFSSNCNCICRRELCRCSGP